MPAFPEKMAGGGKELAVASGPILSSAIKTPLRNLPSVHLFLKGGTGRTGGSSRASCVTPKEKKPGRNG